MAGNSRSGRAPQPNELHVLRGTYRRDRHGSQQTFEPSGKIKRPASLSAAAKPIWNRLAKQLAPLLRPTDETALTMLCEFLALHAAALVEAIKAPTDRAARGAVVAYAAMVDKLASRFGLTPVDRQRLRTTPDGDGGKLDKYIGVAARVR